MKTKSFARCWSYVASVLLILVATSIGASAQGTAPARGYDAYRGIRTRNIFDPDRRGPRIESAPTTQSNRPDFLALTGTMVTSGKTLAFFTGSRSDYNRVIAVRDKVGDYTVAKIDSTHVDLEREGKPLTLEVGKQLALDGTGTVSAINGSSSGGSSLTSSGPSPSSSNTPPPGVPADKAEILRRMMERRQQETSK